jgi:hypothetical protein
MRSAKKIASHSQLNVSQETIQWVLHNDLEMSANKRHLIYGLTNAAVAKRPERSNIKTSLARWHVGHKIIFSNEKMFVLQQQFNVHNYWALLKSPENSLKFLKLFKIHWRFKNHNSWNILSSAENFKNSRKILKTL